MIRLSAMWRVIGGRRTRPAWKFDWALNQNTDIVFGYDHFNLWTFDPEFSADERAVDTVFLKPGFQVAPAVKIGAVGALQLD